MEDKVNLKLSNYFFKNDELVGYLKVMSAYYQLRKRIASKDNKSFYDLILRDIHYILNKHIGEDKMVTEIIRMLRVRVLENQKEGLDEIYEEFIEVLNILNKGIDNSNAYIDSRLKKYRLMKQNINYETEITSQVIESDRIANSYNQKVLKNEIKSNVKI